MTVKKLPVEIVVGGGGKGIRTKKGRNKKRNGGLINKERLLGTAISKIRCSTGRQGKKKKIENSNVVLSCTGILWEV